jgi:hypothetical protein
VGGALGQMRRNSHALFAWGGFRPYAGPFAGQIAAESSTAGLAGKEFGGREESTLTRRLRQRTRNTGANRGSLLPLTDLKQSCADGPFHRSRTLA